MQLLICDLQQKAKHNRICNEKSPFDMIQQYIVTQSSDGYDLFSLKSNIRVPHPCPFSIGRDSFVRLKMFLKNIFNIEIFKKIYIETLI